MAWRECPVRSRRNADRSSSGIATSIQHAVVALGGEPPEIDDLKRFIGPPLRASLAELLGTTDRESIVRAVEHYRERFARVGMFENAVYPGVRDVLEDFASAGHAMWVVTSKPHLYATAIVGRRRSSSRHRLT